MLQAPEPVDESPPEQSAVELIGKNTAWPQLAGAHTLPHAQSVLSLMLVQLDTLRSYWQVMPPVQSLLLLQRQRFDPSRPWLLDGQFCLHSSPSSSQ